jgi:hypothetical protein
MNELLKKAERLEQILVDVATGRAYSGVTEEYRSLRAEFISNPLTKSDVPPFVRTHRKVEEFWQFIKLKFPTYAERRTFIRDQFAALECGLETNRRTPGQLATDAAFQALDSAQIRNTWQKALDRKDIDAEGALTMARTLLEDVCKHLLDASSADYDESEDLPKLYGRVANVLQIAPSQQTETEFRKVFGACHAVVDGLACLRNRLSDAHGKGYAAVRPSTIHVLAPE